MLSPLLRTRTWPCLFERYDTDKKVCATINALIIPFTEGWAPFKELTRIGPLVLSTSAGTAFALNVAAVYLVGATSGLVLTLAGVFKVRHDTRRPLVMLTDQDILLISSSCLFFGSVITPIQVFGAYLEAADQPDFQDTPWHWEGSFCTKRPRVEASELAATQQSLRVSQLAPRVLTGSVVGMYITSLVKIDIVLTLIRKRM